MSRPRLIATDLDGTFLSPRGGVSATNAAALARCAEEGIPVVVVTGRPFRWLDPVRGLRGLHPWVIVSNGAGVYDRDAQVLRRASGIDVATARAVVAELRDAVPGISFGVETEHGFGCEPHTPSDARGLPETEQRPIGELLRERAAPLKLLAFHGGLDAGRLSDRVTPVVAGRLTVTHSTWAGLPGMVEISGPGVDKGSALAALCAAWGIAASEVAAFGDMPNDASMLAWAGHPRVVANAHPELLAREYPVVAANESSGVGLGILRLLDEPVSG